MSAAGCRRKEGKDQHRVPSSEDWVSLWSENTRNLLHRDLLPTIGGFTGWPEVSLENSNLPSQDFYKRSKPWVYLRKSLRPRQFTNLSRARDAPIGQYWPAGTQTTLPCVRVNLNESHTGPRGPVVPHKYDPSSPSQVSPSSYS